MSLNPTPQQQQFIDAAISPVMRNILLNAKAGSGKTTTIVMAVKALPAHEPVQIGCFNRSIKTELEARFKGMDNVICRTSHSLGRSFLPRNVIKDDNKLERHFGTMLKSPEWDWLKEVAEREATFKSIKALTNFMRLELVSTVEGLRHLCIKHGLVLDDNQRLAAKHLCTMMYNDRSHIDFTDMIFLAATLPTDQLTIPKYKYVFIDEAQDLNAAQWAVYRRVLAKDGKIIAVGDKSQAIYGFTGADVKAWDKYSADADVLPLSVCWRCSKAVLDYTKCVDTEIMAAETAREGAVYYNQTLDMVRPGDAVLCRNVKPLVKACFSLLAEGRKAIIQGTDIGEGLIKFARSFKTQELPELSAAMAAKLSETLARLEAVFPNMGLDELMETPAYEYLKDRIECINHMIFNVDEINSLDSLCRFIKKLFGEQTEGVLFSTVHRAKGLGWPRVFILQHSLLEQTRKNQQDWQLEQARNLRYVAYTRAQESLHFIVEPKRAAEKKK